MRPLARVRGLGTAVQCALGAEIAVALFSAWTIWNRRALLVDVRDRRTRLTPARADEVDGLIAAGAILSLVVLVATAVLWVIWFRRAYTNLSTVHRVEHGTGWAIGAWFVPFLNLVRPFRMTREVVVETPSPRLAKPPRLVGWWWGVWIVSGFLSNFGFNANPDSVESLITSDTVAIVAEVVRIVAALLAVAVVRRIISSQVARFGRYVA